MAPEQDCERFVRVLVKLDRRTCAVPLDSIAPLKAEEDTAEAISDWKYYMQRTGGHPF